MPYFGHYRTYSLNQKSIHLGRCVKHQIIRRFSSISQKKSSVLLPSSSIPNQTLNLNSSALTEKPIFRPGTMLTTFNRNQDISLLTKIPSAPPLPSKFTENLSSETIKSTDFSKGIKNHITPSGTDLSQSMLIRPSQITEPPKIIQMAKTKTYSTPIHHRQRTSFRHPEHIKSSIAQRIEELKQASSEDNPSDLRITCEYKNERNWLEEQTELKSSITKNYLELNNRLFLIHSIEFLNNKNLRFHANEQITPENFLTKYFKQISILTILIISILRLIENALSNLSIPGIQIILNFIYIFILITIAIILLTNQK